MIHIYRYRNFCIIQKLSRTTEHYIWYDAIYSKNKNEKLNSFKNLSENMLIIVYIMYLIMNGVTTECCVSSCRIFLLKQMEKIGLWENLRFQSLLDIFLFFVIQGHLPCCKHIFIIYNLEVIYFKLQIILKPLIRSI